MTTLDITNWNWLWKSAAAGLCGSGAHSLLMYVKDRAGILPAFQPYESLQTALGHLVGGNVPAIVPWALSFLNGSILVGFAFGHVYQHLPGSNGATKGLIVGAAGWVLMGLVFFPALGLGLFATQAGSGIAPAAFSLAMLLTYSVVMGMVYAALSPSRRVT